MLINLYGFLEDDFVGRVIIVDGKRTVSNLATQLLGWGSDLYPSTVHDPQITNEQGAVLDPGATILESGLTSGALFRLRDSRP